jgi:hypothetical protein
MDFITSQTLFSLFVTCGIFLSIFTAASIISYKKAFNPGFRLGREVIFLFYKA